MDATASGCGPHQPPTNRLLPSSCAPRSWKTRWAIPRKLEGEIREVVSRGATAPRTQQGNDNGLARPWHGTKLLRSAFVATVVHGGGSATASMIKRPRIIDRESLARHSGTVAGFVGSETWITRYLSGWVALALREVACNAFGGS